MPLAAGRDRSWSSRTLRSRRGSRLIAAPGTSASHGTPRQNRRRPRLRPLCVGGCGRRNPLSCSQSAHRRAAPQGGVCHPRLSRRPSIPRSTLAAEVPSPPRPLPGARESCRPHNMGAALDHLEGGQVIGNHIYRRPAFQVQRHGNGVPRGD
jgi:hypothetical protein